MKNQPIKRFICSIIISILLISSINTISYASDTWQTLGAVGGEVTSYSQFVYNGTPYIAYTEYNDKNLYVKKYSNGSWQLVGEPFENSIGGAIYEPSIFVYNGIPYVAYLDEEPKYFGSNVTVKRYIEGSGWELVGKPYLFDNPHLSENIYYAYGVSLFIDEGIPYVAISDYPPYYGMKSGITVIKYETEYGNWNILGEKRFSEGELSRDSDTPALYVKNGTPYVAFNYYLSGSVKKFTVMGFLYDGVSKTSSWRHIGDMPYTYNYEYESPSLYVDNGNLYVSFIDYIDGYREAIVMKYTGFGGVWQKLGSLKDSNSSYCNTSLMVKDGVPYLAIEYNIDKDYVKVLKYVEDEWITVGNSPIYSGSGIEDISLTRAGNVLYFAFRLYRYGGVRVFKFGEESQPNVSVTVNQSNGGYCSDGSNYYNTGTSIINITPGSSLNLNFAADIGYIISSVYVDGILVVTKPGITWSYNENNITTPKTISVNYAQGYQVLVNVLGNGIVDGQLGYYLNDESVQLTANANSASYLTYWLNNNTQTVYSTNNTVTIDSSTPHSFTARFDPYYTYTSSVEGQGTITPSTEVRATWDESPLTLYYPAKIFNITPNSGYHIEDVLVDGVSVGAVQSYTFQKAELPNYPGNHMIKAIFAQDDPENEDALTEVQEVIGFYEENIADGDLTGIGKNNNVAINRLQAFDNMLKEAQRLIEEGDIEGAIEQLQSAYKKVDGNLNPPDFVEGEAREELAEMILELIELLTTLL